MDAAEIEHAESLLSRVRTSRTWVHLPVELNVRCRAERNARERGQLLLAVVFGVVFYDSFLLSDADLIPDVAAVSAWTRIGIITPLGVLAVPFAWWAVRRNPATRLHHVYVSGVVVLMVAWVCALQVMTESTSGITYFLGAFAIITYYFSALRTSLLITSCTLTAAGLVFVVAMTQASVMVAPIRRDAAMTMVVFVLFGILVTHRFDHTARRLFVAGLRTDVLEALQELRLRQLATLNEGLARDATIDPLTGIPNRRALDAASKVWRDEAKGLRAALIVDLDHFKAYNDGFGHAAGDTCLQRVVKIMVDSLRLEDALLSRYGGEEFVVLLDQVDRAQTARVAERLRAAVEDMQLPAPGGSVVTVSVGAAWASHRELAGVTELIAVADDALYDAKRSGRNTVSFGTVGQPAIGMPVAG